MRRQNASLKLVCIAAGLLGVSCATADYQCRESSSFHSAIKANLCPWKAIDLCAGRETCARVVDDSSAPESWGLWTYRPYCVKVGARESEFSITEGNATKFCVFTSSLFGSNGISIVTRPEVASTVASSIHEAYNSDFPGPETVQNLNLQQAYDVVDMPDKGGKGVLATRKIPGQETFMVDYASVIEDGTASGALSPEQTAQLLTLATNQLLDPDEVWSLSIDVSAEDDTNVVGAIIKTNNFLHEMGDWPQKMLFPIISRINHACLPNVYLRLSSHGLTAGITALRDIEPGEEITASYLPHFLNSSERRSKIQDWGFNCTCDLCSAPAAEAAASDRRRAEIARIGELLTRALQDYDLQAAKKIMENGLRLLADEGLVFASGEFHETLARISWILGDEQTSDEHAGKAAEYADFGFLEPRNRTADIIEMLRSDG